MLFSFSFNSPRSLFLSFSFLFPFFLSHSLRFVSLFFLICFLFHFYFLSLFFLYFIFLSLSNLLFFFKYLFFSFFSSFLKIYCVVPSYMYKILQVSVSNNAVKLTISFGFIQNVFLHILTISKYYAMSLFDMFKMINRVTVQKESPLKQQH